MKLGELAYWRRTTVKPNADGGWTAEHKRWFLDGYECTSVTAPHADQALQELKLFLKEES